MMNYFATAFEVKQKADDTGVFEGYASTYNVDAYGDRIQPGAFGASIAERKGKIPIFRNHNSEDWVGHTFEMSEDGKGLYIRARLFVDTTAGRDAFNLLKSIQDMDARAGLSIGFIPREVDWDGDQRILKDVDIWETSITPFPAQSRAFVTDVKSVRDFERHLREAEGLSQASARRIVAAAKACNLIPDGMSGTPTVNRTNLFEALRGGGIS